jgi:DNA polymerase III alpha subunit (gram-positive type)
MKQNLIVLDLETGGYHATEHPITQLALNVVDPLHFESLHKYSNFVKPYNNLVITPEALQASRVSMQQINKGITVQVLVKDLLAAFKIAHKSGKPQTKPIIVGHNIAEFDMPFLEYLFSYLNKNLYDYVSRVTFDTIPFSKLLMAGNVKSDENAKFNLAACCERFGIELKGAHDALADVEATTQLFKFLTKTLRNGYAGSTTTNTVQSAGSGKRSARDNFFFEF